jgi:hypothetical protein
MLPLTVRRVFLAEHRVDFRKGGRLRALLQFAEHPGARTISAGELSLLLEGSSFTVHARARAWRTAASSSPQAAQL